MILTDTYSILTKKGENGGNKFFCEKCNYLACDKYKFNRHLMTRKHSILTNTYLDGEKGGKGGTPIYNFICDCGNSYKHKQSLNTHKKTCILKTKYENHKNENLSTNNSNDLLKVSDLKENINYKEMFMEMLNQNKELQKMIIKQNEEHSKQILELVPKINQNQNINVTNNVTNIKDSKFDINIFLNEKCKDALSIDQFINKIQISLSDLLVTKDKGLIEGISNIFIENMKQLSLYERPLHCTDTKRETLYIKQDEWKKDENNIIVKDAIKQIAVLQSKNVNNNWRKAHPNFMNNSNEKDDYIQIIKNTMGDIDNKEGKIVKNICKNTYINNTKIE